MGNVRIELNHGVIGQILRGEVGSVRQVLEDLGGQVAEAAGPGHRVESEVGTHRARVAIITDTNEAVHAEATERTLTKALDVIR